MIKVIRKSNWQNVNVLILERVCGASTAAGHPALKPVEAALKLGKYINIKKFSFREEKNQAKNKSTSTGFIQFFYFLSRDLLQNSVTKIREIQTCNFARIQLRIWMVY